MREAYHTAVDKSNAGCRKLSLSSRNHVDAPWSEEHLCDITELSQCDCFRARWGLHDLYAQCHDACRPIAQLPKQI